MHVILLLFKMIFKVKFFCYSCVRLAALNFDDSAYLNKTGNDLYRLSAFTLKVKRRQNLTIEYAFTPGGVFKKRSSVNFQVLKVTILREF